MARRSRRFADWSLSRGELGAALAAATLFAAVLALGFAISSALP